MLGVSPPVPEFPGRLPGSEGFYSRIVARIDQAEEIHPEPTFRLNVSLQPIEWSKVIMRVDRGYRVKVGFELAGEDLRRVRLAKRHVGASPHEHGIGLSIHRYNKEQN
jgi:hypothetical protein